MESSARVCAPRCRVIGASEQRLGRRAGWRSACAGCRSGGWRGRTSNHNGSNSLVPSSRRRRGFRTAREILGGRRRAARVSSRFRDPLCGIPPRAACGDPAGPRIDSFLVGNPGARQIGRRRAFRVRAAACPNRSLCRAAAGAARRLSLGARTERFICHAANFRIFARSQPMRGSRGKAARVLASAGEWLERNCEKTKPAGKRRLGRERASFGRSGSAGIEHEWVFPPPDTCRILEECAAGADRCGCGAAAKDLLSFFV